MGSANRWGRRAREGWPRRRGGFDPELAGGGQIPGAGPGAGAIRCYQRPPKSRFCRPSGTSFVSL